MASARMVARAAIIRALLIVFVLLDIQAIHVPKVRNEPRHEKTIVLVSYLIRHKPDCTATQDG